MIRRFYWSADARRLLIGVLALGVGWVLTGILALGAGWVPAGAGEAAGALGAGWVPAGATEATGAPGAPGAPTVSSVTAGDGSLAVVWTAPGDGGGSPITAYDLRHISSSASDKSDAAWTVLDGIWSSGGLAYTVTGLLGAVSYDVQVRAVNSSGSGVWSATVAGTPTVGAAVIASVAVGDGALTVVWNAPGGIAAASITAYDLRHISNSAPDKSDGHWTVVDSVWTASGPGASRPFQHLIAGLDNANTAGYDVQVRAVTTSDGAWSDTATGTPVDHGDTAATATDMTSGVPLGGVMQSATDADYFKIQLSGTMGIVVHTSGALDTVGTLLDGNESTITGNDDSHLGAGGKNFFIWSTQPAGAYYVKVTGKGGATGSYALHAQAIPDSTGIADAQPVGLGASERGIIHDYGDTDYFKLTLAQAADVIVRVSGGLRDPTLEISDSAQKKVAGDSTGFLLPSERHPVIRRSLEAGVYYVKVAPRYNASFWRDQGPYTIHIQSVAEPGSTAATAAVLGIGDIVGGNIASAADVDYFRIDVTASTEAVIRAVGHAVDMDGSLLDSSLNPVEANIYEETFSRSGRVYGFTIRHTLPVGTHYVKLQRASSSVAAATRGAYTIQALNAADVPANHTQEAISKQCRYSGTAVDDPLYGCQWNLKNTGLYGGTAGEDINVEDVWAAGIKGEGVAVAVVDTDLDVAHEDLRENVDESRSRAYPNILGTGLLHPEKGHGTSVAGVIAARDNHRGLTGVAPRATIYGYNLTADWFTDSELADAMKHNLDSVAVSNNSWGPSSSGEWVQVHALWERAVDKGVSEGFGGKGIFYTWAAGNTHEYYAIDVNYIEYTNYYAVATICALDNEGERAVYSQTGATLLVCAPSDDKSRFYANGSHGEAERHPGGAGGDNGAGGASRQPPSGSHGEAASADVRIVATDRYGGYTADFGGTSAATPTVSGVVALVRSAYPSLTWRDVRLILAGSARKNDASNEGWKAGALKYGSTTDSYEFNHEYGFGAVDAKAAVDLADDWVSLPGFVSESQTSADEDVSIPQTGITVTSTVTVGTTVEFTEFVELNLELDTKRQKDMKIELVSPSGKVSKIADAHRCLTSGCSNFNSTMRFGSMRHLGEDPEGDWTLKITKTLERGSPKTSTLKSWDLKVFGHRSTPGAPVADSTTAVDEGKVTVFWSAPDNPGASAVTAYDVRHIVSDASDKSDSQWTVIHDAGTNGRIRGYTISGLTDGTGYDVQVRAVNAQGDGVWSDTVTGTPAAVTNALPYFTEGAATVRSVSENTLSGVSIGAAVAAVDTDGDTLTYTLGGTDASHFGVAASTAQLSTKGVLDYESKSSYTVTVSVSDGKDSNGQPDTTADDTITVTVGVNDTEEAGAVTLSTNNPLINTAVTATLADPDGDITGTAWSWARSSNKTTWTAITSAASAVYTPMPADRGSYLRATATYTDARGSGKTASAITGSAVTDRAVQPPPSAFTPPPALPSPPPPVPPPPRSLFSDLGDAGVHETAVRALATEGVITGTGCSSGRLCPARALQRWEAAVWLVRILDGEDPTETVSGRFTDVDDAEWWAAHVERLAELGVTLGCSLSPARFCPHGRVTRAQMASFLERAFELPTARQPAGFGDTDGSVHETAIDALHAARVTKGCQAGPLLYCPRDHTTRAQMASFLHRARTA